MMDGTRGAAQDVSTAELVHQTAEQVSRLVRDELALARAEMADKGRKAGLGAGMLGGSGVVAGYGVAGLLTASVLGLAEVMAPWLAAALVAAALFAVAGVLAVLGRKKVSQATPPVPAETVRSVRADISEVKERAQR